MTALLNIPKLRFSGFADEWNFVKVGEITTKVNSGKTPLGGDKVYTDKGIIFIRSQNVADDKLLLEDVVYIPDEVNRSMKNSIVQSGDILLNITGASLGRSCVVPSDFGIGNVNQHVCIVRVDKNTSPQFLQLFLSSQKGQNFIYSLQTGSGREGLNFQSIKQIGLSTPTLPAHTKIASSFPKSTKNSSSLKRKKSCWSSTKKE